jgi:protein SCO1/2
MLKYLRSTLVGLFLSGAATATAAGPDFAKFSHDEALAYSQAAIGQPVGEVELTRADGSAVTLENFRGKPLVISLIFTSCHHICPTTTRNLDEVVQKAREALGADSFEVVSVGFDTRNDTPERMAQFRRAAGVDDKRWGFLSADAGNMAELVGQLGFIFTPSPRGFDHLIQSSIIDAQGKVYRQVYGISFPTVQLVEPLKQLVFGEPREQSTLDYLTNRIRLFCTVYDPASDSYRIDISVFIGTIVGLIVSILFGAVLIKEWRRSIKANK